MSKNKNSKGFIYEVCDDEDGIIYSGFYNLEDAIKYADDNDGYLINKIWLPLDENGDIDFNKEVIATEVAWKRKDD